MRRAAVRLTATDWLTIWNALRDVDMWRHDKMPSAGLIEEANRARRAFRKIGPNGEIASARGVAPAAKRKRP